MSKLKSWVKEFNNIIVFTGAGISTESGIPDFRSPGGIWTKMAPIMFQDFMSSEESQIESWRRKFAIDQDMKIAKPNIFSNYINNVFKVSPISLFITSLAIESSSVDSLFIITNLAPLFLARIGKPAAGYTFKEEPIAIKRSQVFEAFSAIFISFSGIGCPKEIVADLIIPLQSRHLGGRV